jgi:hypothetical protein
MITFSLNKLLSHDGEPQLLYALPAELRLLSTGSSTESDKLPGASPQVNAEAGPSLPGSIPCILHLCIKDWVVNKRQNRSFVVERGSAFGSSKVRGVEFGVHLYS